MSAVSQGHRPTLESLFVDALPSPPVSVLEVVRKSEDPDVTIPALAKLIELDVALSVQIVRMSNSALYSPASEITTVERALTTLGLRSVRLLALSSFSGAYLVRREIMDQNYLFEFRTRDQRHAVLYKIWKATSDCGRSVSRWAAMTVMVALLFALLYTIVDIDYGPNQTGLSPLYFSVVTITTLGYGDALPKSMLAQVLVMVEVAVGYMMLGGVLSIFATRTGRRAD